MVLDRIKDKLSGTDIHPDFVYDAQTQVDKLIKLIIGLILIEFHLHCLHWHHYKI